MLWDTSLDSSVSEGDHAVVDFHFRMQFRQAWTVLESSSRTRARIWAEPYGFARQKTRGGSMNLTLLLDSGVLCPPLPKKHYSFLRLLKNKGFKAESMTKVGLNTIGTSTTLESNKSPTRLVAVYE